MSGCREVESFVPPSARSVVVILSGGVSFRAQRGIFTRLTESSIGEDEDPSLRLLRSSRQAASLMMTPTWPLHSMTPNRTTEPEIVIRRAQPADEPTLGRLGALLVKTHHDFDQRRFIAPTRQTESGYGSFLVSQLTEPKIVVLVAVVDGEVVGYTYAANEGRDWMSLRGPAGALYDIIVDPASRRHGVGRALLAATVAALESLGAPQIVLSTAVRNEAAQRLFERAGFRPTMIEMTRDADRS